MSDTQEKSGKIIELPPFKIFENGVGGSLINQGVYGTGEMFDHVFILRRTFGCREEFMNQWLRAKTKEKYVVFSLTVNHCDLEQFKKFLVIIETRLKIENTIQIRPLANKDNIFLVRVSNWWLSSKIRQEFLTILLRCYGEWRGNSANRKAVEELPIENILFSHTYFNATKHAVRRFLDGGTLMKNGFKAEEGWYNRFVKTSGDGANPEIVLVKQAVAGPVDDSATI
jgi:hypothetical protein